MNVLGLSGNLLSVSALEDEGYEVEFQDGAVLVRSVRAGDQNAVALLGIREGSLYRLLG